MHTIKLTHDQQIAIFAQVTKALNTANLSECKSKLQFIETFKNYNEFLYPALKHNITLRINKLSAMH